MNLYKDAPIVKIVMLKGADGDKSKLSELQNDMTFLTEEQIITLVTNIVDTGEVGDIDTGFVTRLKEQNRGKQLEFWVGTQAEYDEIELAQANTFYIITDDNFKQETEAAIAALNQRIDDISYTDVDEEIADLQTRVTNAESDIDDLETASTDYNIRIGALETAEGESRYTAGDADTIDFIVCGEKTKDGNSVKIRFDIPLKKRADNVTVSLDSLKAAIIVTGTTTTSIAIGYMVGSWNSLYSFASTSYTYTAHDTFVRVEIVHTSSGFASAGFAVLRGTADITIS